MLYYVVGETSAERSEEARPAEEVFEDKVDV